MVKVRIDDLARIMRKSRAEVESMLKSSDVIELNLSERVPSSKEDDELRIFE